MNERIVRMPPATQPKKSRIPTFRKWARKAKDTWNKKAGTIMLAAALGSPWAVGMGIGIHTYHSKGPRHGYAPRTELSDYIEVYKKPTMTHLMEMMEPDDRQKVLDKIKEISGRPFYNDIKNGTALNSFLERSREFPGAFEKGNSTTSLSWMTFDERKFFEDLINKYHFTSHSKEAADRFVNERKKFAKKMSFNTAKWQARRAIKVGTAGNVAGLLAISLILAEMRRRALLKRNNSSKRLWDLERVQRKWEKLNEKIASGKKLNPLEERRYRQLQRYINFEIFGELSEEEKQKLRFRKKK